MNNRIEMGSVARASILLSILIALSGMAAIVLADNPDLCPPNRFSGNVTLNDAPAPAGTVINAFIDGDPRGSTVVGSPGEYEYLTVMGSTSDGGKNVTFTVCGANAEPNGTWIAWGEQGVQMLDLSAEDYEAPAVTDPNANPSAIAANGAQLSQLNVTVTDNCAVGTVTVNLSAIGGSDAQVMECTGGDVYSTITNASVDTPIDDYCLQVNASDIVGNYNDSVCIVLSITPIGGDWRDEWMGPDSDGDPGSEVTTAELMDAVYHWITDTPVRGHILSTTDLMELVAAWLEGGAL
jgi:hypothetical protein